MPLWCCSRAGSTIRRLHIPAGSTVRRLHIPAGCACDLVPHPFHKRHLVPFPFHGRKTLRSSSRTKLLLGCSVPPSPRYHHAPPPLHPWRGGPEHRPVPGRGTQSPAEHRRFPGAAAHGRPLPSAPTAPRTAENRALLSVLAPTTPFFRGGPAQKLLQAKNARESAEAWNVSSVPTLSHPLPEDDLILCRPRRILIG